MWTTKSGEVHEEIHHNKKKQSEKSSNTQGQIRSSFEYLPLCAISRLHGNN